MRGKKSDRWLSRSNSVGSTSNGVEIRKMQMQQNDTDCHSVPCGSLQPQQAASTQHEFYSLPCLECTCYCYYRCCCWYCYHHYCYYGLISSCVYILSNGYCLFVETVMESLISQCIFWCAVLFLFFCLFVCLGGGGRGREGERECLSYKLYVSFVLNL